MNDMVEMCQRVLEIIETFNAKHGYTPTYREIDKVLNLHSTSGVKKIVNQLEAMGKVHIKPKVHRGITLIEQSSAVSVQMHGLVACGDPIDVPNILDPESMISVPMELIPPGTNTMDLFVLQAQGDSMQEAGIHNGDIVIMKKASACNEGDIACVWREDKNGVTLKKIQPAKRGGLTKLQPQSHKHQATIVADNEMEIQGRLIAVMSRHW